MIFSGFGEQKLSLSFIYLFLLPHISLSTRPSPPNSVVSPIASKWLGYAPIIRQKPKVAYANDAVDLDAWKQIPQLDSIDFGETEEIFTDQGSGEVPEPIKEGPHLLEKPHSKESPPPIIDDNSEEEIFGAPNHEQKMANLILADSDVDIKSSKPIVPKSSPKNEVKPALQFDATSKSMNIQWSPVRKPIESHEKWETVKHEKFEVSKGKQLQLTSKPGKARKLDIQDVMGSSTHKFPEHLKVDSSTEFFEKALPGSPCNPGPCCKLDTSGVPNSSWLSPLMRSPKEKAQPQNSDAYPSETSLAINVSACFPLAVEHTKGCMEIAFGGVFAIKCYNRFFRHVMFPSMKILSITCGPC